MNNITGFYRVTDGCIVFDDFINGGFYNGYLFKKIDGVVRYPKPYGCYAVIVNSEEDKELTRAVFGFTYDELNSLLEVYAKVMRTYQEEVRYPRVIRSTNDKHYCELSNMWIPESFPYIAFNESAYHFSHISLWGLYSHLQLLTNYREDSVFSRVLLKYGLDPKILNRLFEIGKNIYHQTKVIKGMK